MFKKFLVLAVVSVLLPCFVAVAGEARLLRFPDIHEQTIAFVHAGDIWVVSSGGGVARRLTSAEGLELFPKFSPDGRSIAFSAEYGGNRQLYVIDVDGGRPKQLTYYNDVGPMPPRGGFDYRVLDWTPDGKQILFRANRLPWGVRMGQPYVIDVDGGNERALAVPEIGGGMFSPDGNKLAYTPMEREFRTWKRHRGGRAQNVWIYDLKRDRAEQITDDPGTDNQPVWVGDKIYFTSDRELRLNLYSYDTKNKQTEKVTDHETFDVLWPSAGPKQIVYESGGYLHRLDPASGKSEQLRIEVAGDSLHTLPRFDNVQTELDSIDISPSGKRAVLGARGDIFTVPAEHGEIRNLTRTPGIREIDAIWSPDARWIAYWSDRSGEYDLYVRSHDGSGDERRVTKGGDIWRFPPRWSPDSKKLAFGDKSQRLRYAELETGKIVDVDRSERNDIRTYRWAPDSRWLAYTKVGESTFPSIHVYSLEDNESWQLTDDLTADYSPAWDPEGRYLYFVSDRDYNLSFSGYEFNYMYTDPSRIYAATLKADGPALLTPRSDDEEPKDEGDEEGESDDDKKSGKKDEDGEQDEDGDEGEDELRIEIDVEGFDRRVIALPPGPSNYGGLAATEDALLFMDFTDDGTNLRRFLLEKEEVETVMEGIRGYVLSADGKKLLFRAGSNLGIADVGKGKKTSEGRLDLDALQMKIDPSAEWSQIFDDGWRILRDWFYDPGMHGIDWDAMRELYRPMVDHVVHRADLDYILGELGGELSAGHFYVNWGDMPRPERVDNGLLGVEIEPHKSGYYRITKIFPGENWHAAFRSPLTVAGVEVSEGDYILAVDGRSTKGVANFYSLLENSSGRVVTLKVNDKPDEDGAREEQVRPISRETNLRYLDWAQSRREMVERLSGGRIGYIHLPNTAGAGNRELRKYFYPLAHKEALIFDVRYNGGGFIPDRMVELLTRVRLNYWVRRGTGANPTPGFAHEGPKACLINGFSSSGGDAFPYYFRKLGLGPLIGMRTWGGLIGLSGNPGFMDGGSINVPTFRLLDTEGNWDVENVGVSPDIEVYDRPDLVAGGADPTLEKAIAVLLEELKKNPVPELSIPEPPRHKR